MHSTGSITDTIGGRASGGGCACFGDGATIASRERDGGMLEGAGGAGEGLIGSGLVSREDELALRVISPDCL